MIVLPFKAFPKYKQSFSLKPKVWLEMEAYSSVRAANCEKAKFVVGRDILYMSPVCLSFVSVCTDSYKLN